MTIAPPEFEVTTATRVACDGGDGALGHPRVYLTIDRDTGYVVCPYCDKLYIAADREVEVKKLFGLDAA
jgi:uncharacterized Zn-finger protein